MKTHIPVLLEEVRQVLLESINKDALVVDATLGRGGHFLDLSLHFNNLIGLDADSESINYVSGLLVEQGYIEKSGSYIKGFKKIKLVNENFINLKSILSSQKASAILFDLGISMFHYKESKRGFSFLNVDEVLDMRIDTKNNSVRACDLLNFVSEKDLTTLFRSLGEEFKAKSYANLVVHYRSKKKILTVGDLLSALRIDQTRKYKIHPATKVFMALRIAVNSENTNLKTILEQYLFDLKNGLVFLIITFHSLEEKTVERFCRDNNLKFSKINPSNEEIIKNKSSRSSKLFVIKNV